MSPLDWASVIVAGGAVLGLGLATAYAIARRNATTGLTSRTALARAGSYAGLAIAVLIATRAGVPGLAVLFGSLGALGLLEWSRLFDLPPHHRVAIVLANVVITWAIAVDGVAAADWLVGGLVL